MGLNNTLRNNSQPVDLEHQQFVEGYERLWHTAEGEYFSFGHTRCLRKSLEKLATTKIPFLKETFRNIPKNIFIESESDPTKVDAAFYSLVDKKILINLNLMKSTLNDTPEGLIFHEMIHANQDSKKLFLMKNATSEQILTSNMLCEAEAKAWEEVYKLTKSINYNNTNPTKEEIRNFMKRDLEKKSDTFKFQQCLKKYGGDLGKATKAFAKYQMKQLIQNKDKNWTNTYIKQGVGNCRFSNSQTRGKTKANTQEYNNMIRYFKEQYGLSDEQIRALEKQSYQVAKQNNLLYTNPRQILTQNSR